MFVGTKEDSEEGNFMQGLSTWQGKNPCACRTTQQDRGCTGSCSRGWTTATWFCPPERQAALNRCEKQTAAAKHKKVNFLSLHLYFSQRSKNSIQPHVTVRDGSCMEHWWHTNLRYHNRTTSKVFLLKDTALHTLSKEPLLSDWAAWKSRHKCWASCTAWVSCYNRYWIWDQRWGKKRTTTKDSQGIWSCIMLTEASWNQTASLSPWMPL